MKWGSATPMACPWSSRPIERRSDMRKIPRVRERTATPAELEDERQRWLRAIAAKPPGDSIRDLRADLKRTTNAPAVSMAELVHANDNHLVRP
jgi:hypothetical protein